MVVFVFSIVPILFIQKSVSKRGLRRVFYQIIPWFLVCFSIVLILIFDRILNYQIILFLDIFFLLFSFIPPMMVSIGILSNTIHSRVQLKSVSNRNPVELLGIYSLAYLATNIAGTIVLRYSIDSSINNSTSNNYYSITIYFVIAALICNFLFPFALYRGLLADTKFWRGLGRHNKGLTPSTSTSSTDDNSSPGNSPMSSDLNDGTTTTRPTTSTIELNIASSSFQSMMTEISSIILDFAYVQVDRHIGIGATSEVFCGRFNNKLVAIKISTPPEITIDELNIFASEAKTCSNLKHINIITFYGICVRPPQIGNYSYKLYLID